MFPEEKALVEWAKDKHKSLSERIKKGNAMDQQDERFNALITDLRWQRAALNSVIAAVPAWSAAQLAAMAARLCVRMPAEFCDQELYQLTETTDNAKRDGLLARIGDVDVSGYDQTNAKKAILPLLQEAAAFALQEHDSAYRAWYNQGREQH